MKKYILKCSAIFCFVLAFEKSYSQGWESGVANNIYASNNRYTNICPLSDGGCITNFVNSSYINSNSILQQRTVNAYRYNTKSQGVFITRFNKYGKKIWDNKPLYTFNLTISDSTTNPYVTDNDTLLGAEINQALQLPNNNIILLLSTSNQNEYNYKRYFMIIDNQGNVIKRVIDAKELNRFPSWNNSNNLTLHYDILNNNIECYYYQIKHNSNAYKMDTVEFSKFTYSQNLILIDSVKSILFLGPGNNYYPETARLFHKSTNYYIYDVRPFPINSFHGHVEVVKLNNRGETIYNLNISNKIVNDFLSSQTTPDFYIDTIHSECANIDFVDIDENNNGELLVGFSYYTFYNSVVGSNGYSVYNDIVFTLDSFGNILKKILIDTTGYRHDVLLKYINEDSLTYIDVNINDYNINNKWKTFLLNTTSGIVINHSIFKPLGFDGYEQKYFGVPFSKKYSANKKDIFVPFIYYNSDSNITCSRCKYYFGIAKIGNNGFPFGNTIIGNVFNDANNNCIKNTLEKGIPNYTITATKNNFNNYGTTDRNGNYFIGLEDSGSYSIAIRNNSMYPLWNAVCNPTQNIIVQRDIAYDTANFALKPQFLCPFNTVNVSTNAPFRIGRPQTYNVNYCNNGTILSPNTYITIKLDSLLVFNSANIPYTTLPNHTYRFNIGNLDFLTCGNFSFVATPRINAVQLNQTLCVEAHIYPDSICTSPNYTGSYIVASAQCLGDSVELKLENRGGNMQQIKKYIVIEDQVMRINRNYQLPRNGTIIEKMPADSGHTYRIIAEQEDALPPSYGDKFATAAIEGCRPNPALNFSTGYFTQFPNYDGEPFRAVSCNVITGAYDPNDKVASPVGYAAQHYIEKNTQIDYQINFQNTGNDTAFKVVVVDTIAPTLDINSILLGVASHTYQFQRTDSNVVQFVFDNILLVDSFRNEPKSHGFVKFKIQQKLNNPNGTKIYNSAGIYFDYNAPIITNRTFHTVGQNFVTVQLINTIKNSKYNVKEVKVFPNPFRDKTQIIVESNELKNPVLLLMNIQGQLIKTISSTNYTTFDIYRDDLSNGMYLFKIMQSDDAVANGKVVVQ